MGILRKAVVGSAIVGLGAIMLSKDKKLTSKLKKNFVDTVKSAKGILNNNAGKKALIAAKKTLKKATKASKRR